MLLLYKLFFLLSKWNPIKQTQTNYTFKLKTSHPPIRLQIYYSHIEKVFILHGIRRRQCCITEKYGFSKPCYRYHGNTRALTAQRVKISFGINSGTYGTKRERMIICEIACLILCRNALKLAVLGNNISERLNKEPSF